MNITVDQVEMMKKIIAQYERNSVCSVGITEKGELGVANNGRLLYSNPSGMLITNMFKILSFDNITEGESVNYADNMLVLFTGSKEPTLFDYGITYKGGVYRWTQDDKIEWIPLNRNKVRVIELKKHKEEDSYPDEATI